MALKMSKKLTDQELEEFEQNRDVWQEVLDGVHQIKNGEFGHKFSAEISSVVETR